jgi:geranylgeranyl reductase family protein
VPADFDVIVVGAGAGGAAAAYYLGQAGLRVLVVDKARLPRYKACGGAIPQPTLARFPFRFDSVIEAMPTSVRFCAPGQPDVDLLLPDRPMAMFMRSQFDDFLLRQAKADVLAGTAISSVTETGDGVQVRAGDRRLTARYLIGADGATSTVARCLRLRKDKQLTGSLEAEVPLNGSRHLKDAYANRAVFSLSATPWGYAWIFPKGDWLSVGIAQFRKAGANLHKALEKEMGRLGIRIGEVKVHGHPLPCYQAPPWPLWHNQPQERLSSRR